MTACVARPTNILVLTANVIKPAIVKKTKTLAERAVVTKAIRVAVVIVVWDCKYVVADNVAKAENV